MIKKKFSAPTPRACFGSKKISSWEGPLILADLWPTAWCVEFAPSRSLSFPHAFSATGLRTDQPQAEAGIQAGRVELHPPRKKFGAWRPWVNSFFFLLLGLYITGDLT